MNYNIIFCISQFVKFNEYRKLSLLNKEIRNKLLSKIPYYIKLEFAINELLLDKYPIKLLTIFNPIKLYKVPIIYKKIYRGNTNYIDYIDSSYFKKYSIIRGIDEINRSYISFYYNNKVTTLFQRYNDDISRWVTGGGSPFGNNVCVFDFDDLNYKESDTIIILSNLLNYGLYIHENIKYELNN